MVTAQDIVDSFLVVENPTESTLPDDLLEFVPSQISLLGLVKLLKDALTSEHEETRTRGVGLLAIVIKKLPKDAVKRQETRTLTDFFCSESTLSAPSIIEALEGLTALAQLPSFGSGDAQQVSKAVFDHVNMSSYNQTIRFLVYSLIDVLLAKHRAGLIKQGTPFLKGYASLAEGEKDPRNLKLAFSIARVLLLEFDISECVEDLFDVTFCYFPINFTPPKDDPYGITSQELQVALRHALSATPHFGPLALPLLLDKLQASTKSAKSQSLLAIQECFPVYGRACVLEYDRVFWEALCVEVFHATDKEMESLALGALKVFLSTLYPEDGGAVKGVATKLSEHCLEELKEADKSQAGLAVKILGAAIESSGRLGNCVIQESLPSFMNTLRNPEQASQRSAIIGHLASLLSSLRTLPTPDLSAFDEDKDELVSLLASFSRVEASRAASLQCLVHMSHLPDFLLDVEKAFVVSCFNELLKTPEIAENASETHIILSGLVQLIDCLPREVERSTLPILFAQLPETASPTDTSYKVALNLLARLCINPHLTEPFILRLMTRIEALALRPADQVFYTHHLLFALLATLRAKVGAGHSDLPKYADGLIGRLFALFLCDAEGKSLVRDDARIADEAGQLVGVLVFSLDESRQAKMSKLLDEAVWDHKPAGLIALAPGQKSASTSLDVLSPSALPAELHSLILYNYALLQLRPTILLSLSSLSKICNTYLLQTLEWQEHLVRVSAQKVLASLVNKCLDQLGSFLSTVDECFDRVAMDASSDLPRRKNAIETIAWIARGLIVRSDSRGYALLDKLLSLFEHPQVGRIVARSLEIVGQDDSEVLSKANFSVTKLLYKQRLFSSTLSKLVQGYQTTSDKAVYLVALSVLLRNIPQQLSISELPKLMPLLLRALDLPDTDLRGNVIDTIALLISESPDAVSDHSSTIITSLLTNASDTTANNPTRISALKCLAVFPEKLPYLTLQHQKHNVIKGLGAVLDDKRKAIRKEAVDCRSKWYLLSG